MRLVITITVLLARARAEGRNFTFEVETKSNMAKTIHCKPYLTLTIDEQLRALSAVDYDDWCSGIRTITNESHIKIPYRLKISGELQLLRCGLLAAKTMQSRSKRYFVKYKVHCKVKRRPQHHCVVEYIFVAIFVLATAGSIVTLFMHFCSSGSHKQVDTSSELISESKNSRGYSDAEEE